MPSCLPVLPAQDDANLDPFIEVQYRHRAPGASPGHEKCWLIGKGDLVMGNGVYAFGGMGRWVPETFALFINEQFGIPSAIGNVPAGINPWEPTQSQVECAWRG